MKPKSEFLMFLYNTMWTLKRLREDVEKGVHPDDHGHYYGRIDELESTIQTMCVLLEIKTDLTCEDMWSLVGEAIVAEGPVHVNSPSLMCISPLNIC